MREMREMRDPHSFKSYKTQAEPTTAYSNSMQESGVQYPPRSGRNSGSSSYYYSDSPSSPPWGMKDTEIKSKRRVVSYKAYTVEGKMKASLRGGFQWVKNKCSQIIRGY